LPTQCDNLADHQFRHASRVAEWTVEHRYSLLRSIFQIDLIRSDTKTADADQILGVLEDVFCQFGFRTDPDALNVAYLCNQFVLRQGSFVELNLTVRWLIGFKGSFSPDILPLSGSPHQFERHSPKALELAVLFSIEGNVHIFISALANGLSCLNVSDLVGRRVRGGILNVSGGLVPKEGLEDMRANFKSKEDVTGGEVASGDSSILENAPAMGIFPDIMVLF
jgi:hypothetical protein